MFTQPGPHGRATYRLVAPRNANQIAFFLASNITVRMDCLGRHEAVATLPVLKQLLAIQIVSQVLVVGDRVVRYGLRWSSGTLREREWFGWHKSFDLFAVVSLQFTIGSNRS